MFVIPLEGTRREHVRETSYEPDRSALSVCKDKWDVLNRDDENDCQFKGVDRHRQSA
jgi:hypothetical protein